MTMQFFYDTIVHFFFLIFIHKIRKQNQQKLPTKSFFRFFFLQRVSLLLFRSVFRRYTNNKIGNKKETLIACEGLCTIHSLMFDKKNKPTLQMRSVCGWNRMKCTCCTQKKYNPLDHQLNHCESLPFEFI